MSYRTIARKLIAGILVLLLGITMGLFAGVRNGTDPTFDNSEFSELSADVNVYRDQFGVPTIIAENLNDLLFVQGYEFARDRSFQLEFYRSLINGELSRLFGEDQLEIDKTVRSAGILRNAVELIDKLTEEEISLITAYINGINSYYSGHSNSLPYELEILGVEPKPWNIDDSVAMGSIVAFTFAFGGLSDEIEALKMISQVGIERYIELYPIEYPPALEFYQNLTDADIPDFTNVEGDNLQPTFLQSLEPVFGPLNTEILNGLMSNNWVVSGNKTVTGNPIIANDPHTSLEAQGLWYRVNLFTTDGEVQLQGMTFPGTPLISFGRNSQMAWGVTSGIMDSVDLFYLNTNETHYLVNDTVWVPFKIITEQIPLGDGFIAHDIRLTEFGPMVQTELGEFVLRWTLNEGYERDNSIRSLLEFNRADDIFEFRESLEYLLTGFNWVFADLNGDIGYQQSGFIPVRKNGYGLIPTNGSNGENGWDGIIPYDQQLSVINPDSGYFATANERVDTNENFYISESYALSYRDDRISEVLENGTDFSIDPNAITLEDMQRLQLDVKSLAAVDLLTPVLNIISNAEYSGVNAVIMNDIAQQLTTWDLYLDTDSIEATVFNTYRMILVDQVFRDELVDMTGNYIYRGIRTLADWLVNNQTIDWFDNINTPNTETYDQMVTNAYMRTIDYLVDRFGSDTSEWQWGDKHRTVLLHPFNGITDVFNIGGEPSPGSSLTVNAISGPSWNEGDIDYVSSYGPYFRMTIEVEQNWNNIYGVVSAGANGNILSPHYDDSYYSWNSNEFHQWHSDLDYIRDNYDHTASLGAIQ